MYFGHARTHASNWQCGDGNSSTSNKSNKTPDTRQQQRWQQRQWWCGDVTNISLYNPFTKIRFLTVYRNLHCKMQSKFTQTNTHQRIINKYIKKLNESNKHANPRIYTFLDHWMVFGFFICWSFPGQLGNGQKLWSRNEINWCGKGLGKGGWSLIAYVRTYDF